MKNFRNILYFLAFGVILAVNIWFRLYPVFLPGLDKKAQLITHKGLEQRIQRGEIAGYTQGDFNRYAHAIADDLKSNYRNNNGQTYLLEFDPYGWALATKQIIEHGFPGTRLKDGKAWDDFSLAPQGKGVDDNQVFFYTSAFLYKTWTRLFGVVDLEQFLFYLPLFYVLVFLIFLFFVCRYFFGVVCGLMAMFFVGLGPLLLQRSCAGWFDTDIVTVFFPLLIIFFLAGTCDKNKTLYRRFFFAALSLLGLFLFSYAWVGWWYCWAFCVAAILLIVGLDLFSSPGIRGWPLIMSFLFLVIFLLFGFILLSNTWDNYKGVRSFASFYNYWAHIGSANSSYVWPNTLVAVIEFMRPTANAFNFFLPGKFFTAIACFSSFFGIYYARSGVSRNFAISLFIWFLAGIFMACQSVRFILFAWVPAGIFLALFFSVALRYIFVKIDRERVFFRKVSLAAAIVVVLIAPAVVFVAHARDAMEQVMPAIDRKWVSALEYIRDNTPEQAIVNSWWDRGNWFKYVSQRRTIIDGQTLMRPAAYWMGRVMLSADENEALNILRMLNNDSDKLFYEIHLSFVDDFACIAFMDKLVKCDKIAAEKLFDRYKLPQQVRQRITDVMYTAPRAPAYFVVDESMLGSMASISAIGGCDLAQLYISRHLSDSDDLLVSRCGALFGISRAQVMEKKEHILNNPKGDQLFKFSEKLVFSRHFLNGKVSGGILNFFDYVKLDLKHKIAYMGLPGGPSGFIKNVFIFDGKELSYDQNTGNGVLPETALFVDTPTGWQAIFTKESKLVSTLFSRLFFMNGYGLTHFKVFKDGAQDGIFVYEIIWDQQQ